MYRQKLLFPAYKWLIMFVEYPTGSIQSRTSLKPDSIIWFKQHPALQTQCKWSELRPSEQRAGIYMQFVCDLSVRHWYPVRGNTSLCTQQLIQDISTHAEQPGPGLSAAGGHTSVCAWSVCLKMEPELHSGPLSSLWVEKLISWRKWYDGFWHKISSWY